jgi:uncharacterized protein (TIGR03083 family)
MTDYSILPPDKAELMRRIHHEWAALERVIESLNDEQMTVPDAGGWSIKDNLAHLTVWETFMRLHYLQNLPAHEVLDIDEEVFKRGDEDEMNDIFLQRSKDRSVSDVLSELRQTHEQVLADLAQVPFTDLMKQYYPDDPEARPLLCWVIYNTYDHYQEHRLTIEKIYQTHQKNEAG